MSLSEMGAMKRREDDPGARLQVTAAHYKLRSYVSGPRWSSFWCQIEEVQSFDPESVLEVGPGPGIVTHMLGLDGMRTLTVDLDPALGPDLVGSVTALPLPAQACDVVLCCQVLEHLPLEELEGALRELFRVARRGVVVSLPDRDRFLGVRAYGLVRQWVDRVIEIPRRRGRRATYLNPGHHWEIGVGDVGLTDVLATFDRAGGVRPRTYRNPGYPWHRFFVASLT